MINYPITANDLETLIDQFVPSWRRRALSRTDTFRRIRRYQERSSIWSEIKVIYMRLQNNKCAFCERKFEGAPLGAIEHDVEHFRPKNAVKDWPPSVWPPSSLAAEGTIRYRFNLGSAWAEGYYLLAYHILNYAVACKVCNSVLKSNFFPIYGPRGPQSDDILNLSTERPLLIYPIGDVDTDPESLLTFNGIIPIPCGRQGYASYRARVTIDFFVLEKREILREERATQIKLLHDVLVEREQAQSQLDLDDAQSFIDFLTSPSNRHTNCARAYHRLFQNSRAEANDIYQEVRRYLLAINR